MGDLNLTPGPGQSRGSETILSEEMWEKVLMNLTDPSDVLNAGKTCVQFQRIFGSKMVEANLAKTFPILMGYMDRNSVLKCRGVSKGWMGVVDSFFENYFLGRTIREPVKWPEPFIFTTYDFALYSFAKYSRDGDGERFMREMKDHPRNPIIGRAVHFEFLDKDEEEDDPHDFRIVYKFFETFGKHIWTMTLNICEQTFPIEVQREHVFPFIIRDIFELAPNLKNLYIKGVPTLTTVSMSNNEIRALAPPVALEKLEISEPLYDHQDYDGVEKAILLRHSNSQLRVLHTERLDLLQNLEWPNLKELHFTRIERINELDVVFRNLLMPKLELLSVGLRYRAEVREERQQMGQKYAFKIFFIALHRLNASSPNLKTLRFDNTCLWSKDSAMAFPRGLPCPENIKTLEIREDARYGVFNGISDYSFLLRFPHVENIHVNKGDDGSSRRSGAAMDGEIVEVHKFMYSGRMYESNIWKLLPKLKIFSYGERVYTRSSYERRIAK